MYLHRTQQQETKKEPAVLNAEKIMRQIISGDVSGIATALDADITFNCPMGLYKGRPYVRAWLQFELALLRPYADKIRHISTTSDDGMKVARTEWAIGGLRFTDVITQTPLLTVRDVRRTMRRASKNQAEHDLAERLLLAWTGPYFAKYISPPTSGLRATTLGPQPILMPAAKNGAPAPTGAVIDNRALVLPVLDYSHMGITKVRDLLKVPPKGGKAISDASVIFHFLHAAVDAEREANEAQTREQQAAAASSAGDFGQNRDEITIKARSRTGEARAIIIDRAALTRQEQSKIDALEDSEFQFNRDRTRYVCSGLRLCNNALADLGELETVCKVYLVNAFYFLSIVDLSSNQLTAIPDLSQFPIQSLYLHDNKISDWSQVAKLRALPQLTTLTLFGNPLQQGSESARAYKFSVLVNFFYEEAPFVPSAHPPPKDGAKRRPSSPTPPTSGDPKAAAGVVTLRTLDHCVVTRLEVDAIRQHRPTILAKLRAAQARANSPTGGQRSASPKHK